MSSTGVYVTMSYLLQTFTSTKTQIKQNKNILRFFFLRLQTEAPQEIRKARVVSINKQPYFNFHKVV